MNSKRIKSKEICTDNHYTQTTKRQTILRASKEKQPVNYKRFSMILTDGFSKEIMEAKRQ